MNRPTPYHLMRHNNKHFISALLGSDLQQNTIAAWANATNAQITSSNTIKEDGNVVASEIIWENGSSFIFSRLRYDFLNKYFITGNFDEMGTQHWHRVGNMAISAVFLPGGYFLKRLFSKAFLHVQASVILKLTQAGVKQW